MPNIRFDGVTKSYGSTLVLPPFDLDLNEGEFTVFVGPSGCGKSTTLRMIAGLEALSGGEILFDEKPISHLPSKERDLAMVFQDYALYPHMNIAKNMSFALRLNRTPKAEIDKTVKRVADVLNIGHLLHRKPGELSGGQRQRVAMGRALVRDTSTFLFDEPLSNLDAKLRAKMRTELAEMRDSLGKNMIYVTHDQIEAMTLGHRIVVMADGKIQQQGSPQELFSRPANRFVAGFIGSPTMNFLDGELAGSGADMKVTGAGFSLPLSAQQSALLADRKAVKAAVTVGIRPTSFSMNPSSGTTIDLAVSVSEYLGAHSVLVTRCGETEVLVEVAEGTPIQAGATLSFGLQPEDILLFDPDTGAALSYS